MQCELCHLIFSYYHLNLLQKLFSHGSTVRQAHGSQLAMNGIAIGEVSDNPFPLSLSKGEHDFCKSLIY